MKSPLKRRTLLVNGALGVLLVAGVGAAYFTLADDGAQAQQGRQRVSQVARGTVQSSVSASGSVASARSRSLSFGTSGTVKKIYVKAGDKVSKGDVLGSLDQSSAQDSLEAARLTYDAAADTLSGTSSSKADAYAKAYSSYVQAKNAYRSAEQTLSDTVLKAPFGGTITAVNGDVGDSSSGSSSASSSSSSSSSSGSGGSGSGTGSGSGSGGSGSSSSSSSSGSGSSSGFFELVDTKSLEIQGNFTESDTTKLKVGQKATVTFDALTGKTATGKISEIAVSPTTTNNVVTYPVTIKLTEVPSGVRVGQTSTVEIVTGSASDVLYVPTAAIKTAGGQSTVTVMVNGKQVVKTVETGIKGDQGTEIKSGLEEGDQIVITSTTTGTGTTNLRFPGGGAPGGGFGGGAGGAGGGARGGGTRR
ncbi:HlyD family efflux transporter periplasmic adaptor subunit [Actinomadura barringtoniae]|uniref:HlyD family efflux transporter periplasmic adaptor subunit n=1 Tax=Actinomadura barringtoniae TaxID=1427535 RepID=A0A939PK62_9ACTN|nr:HlyD family efflux transporter periplasmic adaptor subunit [Actinomadura barringtoniae]MBO2451593.1 HlyD family efflux transporter periplasmic adaptor subunit [Actinomadura barringtoniae]